VPGNGFLVAARVCRLQGRLHAATIAPTASLLPSSASVANRASEEFRFFRALVSASGSLDSRHSQRSCTTCRSPTSAYQAL
jgi:hypothetical protein